MGKEALVIGPESGRITLSGNNFSHSHTGKNETNTDTISDQENLTNTIVANNLE